MSNDSPNPHATRLRVVKEGETAPPQQKAVDPSIVRNLEILLEEAKTGNVTNFFIYAETGSTMFTQAAAATNDGSDNAYLAMLCKAEHFRLACLNLHAMRRAGIDPNTGRKL